VRVGRLDRGGRQLPSFSVLETDETPTTSVIRCRYPPGRRKKEMARDGTNETEVTRFSHRIPGSEVVGNQRHPWHMTSGNELYQASPQPTGGPDGFCLYKAGKTGNFQVFSSKSTNACVIGWLIAGDFTRVGLILRIPSFECRAKIQHYCV